MPVTLKNTSKRTRQFHLPKSVPGTVVEQFRIVTNKHGEARYRKKKVIVPAVLTMAAGEVCKDLPDQVLASAQIKKALANPKDGLRLMAQTKAAPAPKAEAKLATESKPAAYEPKATTKKTAKAGE